MWKEFIIYVRKETAIIATDIAQDSREQYTVYPKKERMGTENATDAGQQEKMIEMEMLEKVILWLYLLWASWHDIRHKAIPIIGLLAGGLMTLIYLILSGSEKGQWMAMLPGIGLFLLAKISNGIGEADGIILLFVGCVCSISKTLLLFSASLIYIFLYSAIVFIVKRNRESQIPYIPFLLAAYITTWKMY